MSTIEIPVATAQAMITFTANALNQAFGGGGVQLMTTLQAIVNAAEAAAHVTATAPPDPSEET